MSVLKHMSAICWMLGTAESASGDQKKSHLERTKEGMRQFAEDSDQADEKLRQLLRDQKKKDDDKKKKKDDDKKKQEEDKKKEAKK